MKNKIEIIVTKLSDSLESEIVKNNSIEKPHKYVKCEKGEFEAKTRNRKLLEF